MAFRMLRWDARTFPSPGQVAGAIARLLGRGAAAAAASAPPGGALLRACGISLLRLAIGFFFTALVGVILGLATWRWTELDPFLNPLLVGLQSVPSVCRVPLAVLLHGLGATERGVPFVTVMGSTFAVALNLRDGLAAIPQLYQRAGLMLGAGGWRLYRYILLP